LTVEELLSLEMPPVCDLPAAVWVDGQHPISGPDGSAGIFGPHLDEAPAAFAGDLDGDGRDEGVVTTYCSFGGNSFNTDTFLFRADGSLFGRIPIEDHGPNVAYAVAQRIVDGRIDMRTSGYSPDDPRCCPTIIGGLGITWDGGSFGAVPPESLDGPITPSSVGPIEIGIPLEDLAMRLRRPVTIFGLDVAAQVQDPCIDVDIDGFEGGGLAGDGVLRTVMLYESDRRTDRGIAAGATRAEVAAAYPEAVPFDNIYQDEDDLYLEVDTAAGPRALRFIFGGDVLRSISAGEPGWVQLPEGCL
jgi:hypothetical protein